MRRRVGARLGAIALLLAGGVGAFEARAAEPASTMVVFDGSGSMWGNYEGAKISKLILGRLGLRRALGAVPAQTNVGLVSFGHRRGDCSDVEVMRAPEPVDTERVMAPLERLNPRGRGPVALAVREAARAILAAPGPRSVVLIHDDADNCGVDVCALASDLRENKIVAHVVGLALKPDDAAKMACLPQITGGRMFNTSNPDQVAGAIEDALRLASGDAVPLPSEAPGAQQPAAPSPAAPAPAASGPVAPGKRAPPVAADAPPGLYLRALLTGDGDLVAAPLQWRVTPEDKPDAPVYDARAESPFVTVPPGRYVVEARSGPLAARQTVELAGAQPLAVNLALNAGTLRVRALVEKTHQTAGDALITIADLGHGSEGKAEIAAGVPVAVFRSGEAVALLAAGRYLVRVEQGLVRSERSVVVPAGSQGRIDIPLNAGRVQLTAMLRDGGTPLEAPLFSVMEDDPDSPRGRRELARSAARTADFVLPPGSYYISVRQGLLETRERLALTSGDAVKRTLTLAGGRLMLSTRLSNGEAPTLPIAYRVERIDASPPEVWTTTQPSPVLVLPVGRYRVEGRYGLLNALTVREVEIRSGQGQQLVLEHQAAGLRLLLTAAGGGLPDVLWVVRDEGGRAVWTTGQSEAAAVVQAGRYTVRAETRDKRYERAVELRPGEIKAVEIAAD